MLNSSRAIKIMACTVVGTGEGSPLYDPGSELCFWEGESSASITINGSIVPLFFFLRLSIILFFQLTSV